ncbi:hypothetical protein CASFOL_031172 [Castilleja foliolosa]|uniref:F-box domain-containing protein n=1 Tax=Castilleja foliolosa TaxID=1961234 RepID=A0ABD3C5C7_9LAMI
MNSVSTLKTIEEENKSKMVGKRKCSYMAARTRPIYFRRCKRTMSKTIKFESLPDEIILEILVRVPAEDIYNSVKVVCRKWYKMIHTRNFIYTHLHQQPHVLLAQYSCYRFLISRGKKDLIETLKITPPLIFISQKYQRDDCIAVLTVGVDKDWTRRVRMQHLCCEGRNLLFKQKPLTTDGFVHWVRDAYSEYVLTLNLETEIITPFLVPTCLPRHEGYTELMYRYLPMGKYLSLLVDVTRFSWEVWKMKPESGEWTKMFNIDLEPEFASSLYCVLTPLGWLKFGEELIFSVRRVNGKGNKRYNSYCTRICIAYNVRRREYEPFELAPNLDSFLVHRNSLVWLDGC